MVKKQAIILIGGGGHCKSVIDVIEKSGIYEITGILDKKEKIGQKVSGYEIVASDDDIQAMVRQTPCFHITVGQIQNSRVREGLYKQGKQAGGIPVVVTSPLAYVSAYASIGEGSVVMHHALINAGAYVGCNTIINSKALIEHDATIGDHCHMATGAIINGGCKIGSHTFIGSGATVIQGIHIGEHIIVGAGAVVTHHLTAAGVYAGVPVRLVKS